MRFGIKKLPPLKENEKAVKLAFVLLCRCQGNLKNWQSSTFFLLN